MISDNAYFSILRRSIPFERRRYQEEDTIPGSKIISSARPPRRSAGLAAVWSPSASPSTRTSSSRRCAAGPSRGSPSPTTSPRPRSSTGDQSPNFQTCHINSSDQRSATNKLSQHPKITLFELDLSFQFQPHTVPRRGGSLFRQQLSGPDLLLARGALLRRLEGERGRPRVRRRLGEGGERRQDPRGGGKFRPAFDGHLRPGDAPLRKEAAGDGSGGAAFWIINNVFDYLQTTHMHEDKHRTEIHLNSNIYIVLHAQTTSKTLRHRVKTAVGLSLSCGTDTLGPT